MTGRIRGISGPTVSVDLKGLKLYERVYVGDALLTGEVVRLDGERAVVQVYEDTRGLAVGEMVRGAGTPLTVRLAVGLLSGLFDGLQRPLEQMRAGTGPFIKGAGDIQQIDDRKKWLFYPLRKKGEEVGPYEEVGYCEEGPFRHYVLNNTGERQIVTWFSEGEVSAGGILGGFESGRDIPASQEWPVRAARPFRKKIAPSVPLVTGHRSIDFLFPLAKGGTAILPGGFGTGKTVLEQAIAKFADVDIVVYVGCGERGNEMAELIEEFYTLKDPWTQRPLTDRTILVVNTSNMPVAAREASIYTAVTMAEYYRDMGYHVLFLADSLSRWAEALREISSSLEEMPGEEGYPTYLSSRLSSFIERAGVVETLGGKVGSLSMILSVSPPGGDFTEPVTQACLRSTGTFLMLDTALAHRRHFPAINWFQSYSLYAKNLSGQLEEQLSTDWTELQRWCRDMLQKEESLREVAEIIGTEGLQDADRLLMRVTGMIRTEFLCQNSFTDDAFSAPEQTLSRIQKIRTFHRNAEMELAQGKSLDEVFRIRDEII